eukprot:7959596-Pyramimonas_sp.AAC.1
MRAICSEAGHLSSSQVEDHRRKGKRVVCGDCRKRGRTAKEVSDAAKRLTRELTRATRKKGFARQEHTSAKQESQHFARKSKAVCAE